MGLKVDYTEKDGESFDVFLKEITADSEQAERDMLREAGEQVKEYVVANLNRHRRALTVRYKGRPAMADDVKISIRKDKWGGSYARVMGGKRTGTLWHLVNDGNLHSTPTHFMDEALNKLDSDIDNIWDEVVK